MSGGEPLTGIKIGCIATYLTYLQNVINAIEAVKRFRRIMIT